MSKIAALIGSVALGAAAVTTFVVVQTAGSPAAGSLGAGEFDASVNPANVTVTCAAGATSGTAAVELKVSRNAATDSRLHGGDNVGKGQRVVVTWDGGSKTITQFDRAVQVGPGTTFPCPSSASAASDIPTPFSFQLYKGSTPIGDAVVASTTFHRVGSPS
jgi:hypothetical protein